MWRKVLAPTLLVISIWIVVGGVTTFYIHWLAELHTRVLNENVGTIQAVADMQDSLLRLQTLTASDAVRNCRGRPASRNNSCPISSEA